RPVGDEAAGDGREAGGPKRPERQHGAGREGKGAERDEQRARERRPRERRRGLLVELDGRRASEESVAREPDPEERPAPLVDERRDRVRVAVGERAGDLSGRVPCLGQRRSQLRVRRLGACRRDDPERELTGLVERVLQPRQLVEGLLVSLGAAVVCERLEPRERGDEARPEIREGARVTLPAASVDPLLHEGAIITGAGRVSRPVAVQTVRTPAAYEDHLRNFLRERAEEVRAVRVGEKEV